MQPYDDEPGPQHVFESIEVGADLEILRISQKWALKNMRRSHKDQPPTIPRANVSEITTVPGLVVTTQAAIQRAGMGQLSCTVTVTGSGNLR